MPYTNGVVKANKFAIQGRGTVGSDVVMSVDQDTFVMKMGEEVLMTASNDIELQGDMSIVDGKKTLQVSQDTTFEKSVNVKGELSVNGFKVMVSDEMVGFNSDLPSLRELGDTNKYNYGTDVETDFAPTLNLKFMGEESYKITANVPPVYQDGKRVFNVSSVTADINHNEYLFGITKDDIKTQYQRQIDYLARNAIGVAGSDDHLKNEQTGDILFGEVFMIDRTIGGDAKNAMPSNLVIDHSWKGGRIEQQGVGVDLYIKQKDDATMYVCHSRFVFIKPIFEVPIVSLEEFKNSSSSCVCITDKPNIIHIKLIKENVRYRMETEYENLPAFYNVLGSDWWGFDMTLDLDVKLSICKKNGKSLKYCKMSESDILIQNGDLVTKLSDAADVFYPQSEKERLVFIEFTESVIPMRAPEELNSQYCGLQMIPYNVHSSGPNINFSNSYGLGFNAFAWTMLHGTSSNNYNTSGKETFSLGGGNWNFLFPGVIAINRDGRTITDSGRNGMLCVAAHEFAHVLHYGVFGFMLGYRHGGEDHEGEIREEDQNNRFTRGFGTEAIATYMEHIPEYSTSYILPGFRGGNLGQFLQQATSGLNIFVPNIAVPEYQAFVMHHYFATVCNSELHPDGSRKQVWLRELWNKMRTVNKDLYKKYPMSDFAHMVGSYNTFQGFNYGFLLTEDDQTLNPIEVFDTILKEQTGDDLVTHYQNMLIAATMYYNKSERPDIPEHYKFNDDIEYSMSYNQSMTTDELAKLRLEVRAEIESMHSSNYDIKLDKEDIVEESMKRVTPVPYVDGVRSGQQLKFFKSGNYTVEPFGCTGFVKPNIKTLRTRQISVSTFDNTLDGGNIDVNLDVVMFSFNNEWKEKRLSLAPNSTSVLNFAEQGFTDSDEVRMYFFNAFGAWNAFAPVILGFSVSDIVSDVTDYTVTSLLEENFTEPSAWTDSSPTTNNNPDTPNVSQKWTIKPTKEQVSHGFNSYYPDIQYYNKNGLVTPGETVEKDVINTGIHLHPNVGYFDEFEGVLEEVTYVTTKNDKVTIPPNTSAMRFECKFFYRDFSTNGQVYIELEKDGEVKYFIERLPTGWKLTKSRDELGFIFGEHGTYNFASRNADPKITERCISDLSEDVSVFEEAFEAGEYTMRFKQYCRANSLYYGTVIDNLKLSSVV